MRIVLARLAGRAPAAVVASIAAAAAGDGGGARRSARLAAFAVLAGFAILASSGVASILRLILEFGLIFDGAGACRTWRSAPLRSAGRSTGAPRSTVKPAPSLRRLAA